VKKLTLIVAFMLISGCETHTAKIAKPVDCSDFDIGGRACPSDYLAEAKSAARDSEQQQVDALLVGQTSAMLGCIDRVFRNLEDNEVLDLHVWRTVPVEECYAEIDRWAETMVYVEDANKAPPSTISAAQQGAREGIALTGAEAYNAFLARRWTQ